MRLRRCGALLLVVALGAACQIRTEVGIDVEADGSGVVTVGVGLDDDALEQIPGIEDELRIQDLEQTGWTVTGPAREPDGLTWFRVAKPFATPEEAGSILDEVAGETGPFADFRIRRSRSFARTTYEFDGAVDFERGLESFTDQQLADTLDGQPLGESVDAIEARIGQTIDQVFTFRVAVRLPGSVESNAPTQASNGAVWQPRLSEPGPVVLHASSTMTRWGTLALTLVAALALLTAVVVLLWRPRRRRRLRHAAT